MNYFYNQDLKEKFINGSKASYENMARFVLSKSLYYETKLSKDLYDFSFDEIALVMKSLKPKTKKSARTMVRVLNNYLTYYEYKREDRTNPLFSVDQKWYDQFVDKENRGLVSEKQLDEILSKLVNPIDAVILQLIFEGVGGESNCEILNLKKDHIEWDTNTLLLFDDKKGERTLRVSDKCLKLLKDALNQGTYHEKNGNSKSKQPIKPLVKNNYVIRAVDRKVKIKNERVQDFHIQRKFDMMHELLDVEGIGNVTVKTVRYSGMMIEAVNVSVQTNTPLGEFNHKDHWSKIAEKFNISSAFKEFHAYTDSIVNNIDFEFVEENYGEFDEYKMEDFKLVEKEENDIESFNRKKRENQPLFRDLIISVYDCCVITGERFHGVLEACHIQPYINKKSNHIQNGIMLRIDFHKLFDNGLLTIDENYKVKVSRALKSDYYQKFDGLQIHLPTNEKHYPSQDALYEKLSLFNKTNVSIQPNFETVSS